MNNKIKTIIVTALGLVLFVAAYFALKHTLYAQVLLYFLILFGLLVACAWPHAAVFTGLTGIVLLFTSPFPQSWVIIDGISCLLIASVIIPYYFDWSNRWEQEKFRQRHEPQVNKFYALQSTVNALKEERRGFESEIEKINQLYVLGRELVEHMDMSEVVEHLQRILLNRPGLKSVSIFSWEKSKWKPLSLSAPEQVSQWLEFIGDQRYLSRQPHCSMLLTPQWLGSQAVVFWPVRLEKELLAAIFLVTDADHASRYLEEGTIFIPQIALGLKRIRLFTEVKERSRTDGLTGLYRRSYFLERLQTEIKRAERYKAEFSILMMDIDHFKKVNDTYGHLVGDEILRKLSQMFTGVARDGDMLGRYGGEEFVIFLYLASPSETRDIGHKINKTIAEHVFTSGNSTFNVTISIGVSSYPADGATVEELLSAADQALYWVKAHGRNGVKEFRDIAGAQPEPEPKKRKKHNGKKDEKNDA